MSFSGKHCITPLWFINCLTSFSCAVWSWAVLEVWYLNIKSPRYIAKENMSIQMNSLSYGFIKAILKGTATRLYKIIITKTICQTLREKGSVFCLVRSSSNSSEISNTKLISHLTTFSFYLSQIPFFPQFFLALLVLAVLRLPLRLSRLIHQERVAAKNLNVYPRKWTVQAFCHLKIN
jgi:hypothetical protein